ncbi:serine/threonine protein kinase [Microcoleus vaginatus PCC 9802]|uniref:serine/threonine protein kinase n=1 Tax=Microcoleus vaginatus TaxID=119532 RepID=UPI00020D302D|nr:serine/threonine protein kinase [Microcoleus vaginatus FGP-2]UNU20433.1 serine/threonine protein kinase [Microcoleus vaginatus PCC 9802]
METLQQSEKIIAEKYRIIGKLGQGGVGITYAAVDLNSNQKVALKALSLRLTTEWKKVELFEREAKTLSGLNHPGIPRYIDYFQVDTDQDRCFYIAQQLAPGKSLAQLIENGWKPNEAQVRHIACQLLEILVYLQSLLPATIHRDIKPQNIILQKNGRVFLVDFGAVQNTYHHTVTGGSTVVGTYGYMAPEQFRGKAVLSTDLYGLGTTLLFLLTQKFPSDLPRQKQKIKFRARVSISPEFADWLEKIIEPAIEARFHSAKDALSALRGEQQSGINPEKMFKRSPQSRITLIDAQRWLFIKIYPDRFPSKIKGFFQFIHLSYKVLLPFSLILVFFVSLGYICHMSSSTVGLFKYTVADWLGKLFDPFFSISILAIIIFTVFYALMWLCRFLCRIASRLFIRPIKITPQDIQRVKLSGIHLPLLKKSMTFCRIRTKSRNYCFGLFLPQAEKEWLVGELNDCLSKLK